jgi:exoribonuclease R
MGVGPFDLAAAAEQVMAANGFRPVFPPEVSREVTALQEALPPAPDEVRDLRGLLWSSIDNRESRDLDQVEVAEPMADDGVRVRVGVADVDSRVARMSATDVHAGLNTTSVYTGVTVFPMLPERLSTDLTSLGPGEDRLAVVVEMDLDREAAVVRAGVYRALLRNHAKLEYDGTGAWLAGDAPVPPEVSAVPGLEEQVRLQDAAAQRLLARRRRTGVLDLETVEPRPVVARGRIIDLQPVARGRARELIENFMVAANGALARFVGERGLPALRRVVRVPKRWDRIVAIAAELGEKLPAEPDARALSTFLARRRTLDPVRFPDLSLAVIKLLGPGEYVLHRPQGGRPAGHFSLGAAEYAHGTAPNRRYPDLVLQRLVKGALAGAPPPYPEEELERLAAHCTEREDAARKVERTMRKRAAAVLMADRIGESFVGVVTGASSKGTYVRILSPPVEGRVVRGEQGLDVGDTVRVTLVGTDAEQGYIDFEGPRGDVRQKLERSRLKKRAAARLAPRAGQTFRAVVTAASPKGTWVRLPRERAEGKVVRGHHGLAPGQRIDVTLVSADSVHGFIDFEHAAGVEPRKRDRQERKREAARHLLRRVGDTFDAVVTGAGSKATYVRVMGPEAEGRLVRGRKGLRVGDGVRVVLLAADPRRGFIDFARED